VLAIAALAVNLTGCDQFPWSKSKGLEQLTAIEQRWADGIKLASSTGRGALSNPVANLQQIKRDLSLVQVSKCLEDAKPKLESHMENIIAGFFEFMHERKYSSDAAMERATEAMTEYVKSKALCK
jgi:hypothetical protein